jgi:hypothetical protein
LVSPATKNASASIITMGILNGESAVQNILSLSFDYSTGANSGLLSLNIGGVVSSTALAFSAADVILLTLERNQDVVTATATNTTTGTSYITISYVYTASVANVVNTGQFAINNTSTNSIIISSIDIGSTETMNPNLAVIGTSKTVGHFANDLMTSYPRKLQDAFPGTVILAGGFDKSQDYLNRLPELLALKPKQVILEPSVNDIIQSVASATWQANLASVVTQLQAAGIKVFLLDGIYDTNSGGNSSGLFTWVHATYPASMIIQSYTIGQETIGSVNGDTIHPSQLGHDIVFQAIIDSHLIFGGIYGHKDSNYSRSLNISDALNIGNNIIAPSSIKFPGTTTSGSAMPTFIDLGSSFSNPGATLANLKLKLYNNGSGNLAGFTLSGSDGLEAHTYSGSWHSWFINSVRQALLNATELRIVNGQLSVWNGGTQYWTINGSGISFNGGGSSATPAFVDCGTGFSSSAGVPSSCKVMIYHSGSNVIGFGFSVANGLENHAYLFGHTWFINAVLQMQLNTTGLSIVTLKTGSTAPTSSGTTKMVITDANGLLSFKDSETSLINSTPTITAGTGAGTSPTLGVTTNGKQLQVTITTGTSPIGSNATIAIITLPTALTYIPFPVFSAANSNAANISGASTCPFMGSSGSANVTVTSGSAPLAATTTYIWNIQL